MCEEAFLPRLERVLDLSIMALLLGLFRTDLLASDISAVTRVIEILKNYFQIWKYVTQNHHLGPALQLQFSVSRINSSYRPSNLCLRKSKSAFCIMSVTCTGAHIKNILSALLDFTFSLDYVIKSAKYLILSYNRSGMSHLWPQLGQFETCHFEIMDTHSP